MPRLGTPATEDTDHSLEPKGSYSVKINLVSVYNFFRNRKKKPVATVPASPPPDDEHPIDGEPLDLTKYIE